MLKMAATVSSAGSGEGWAPRAGPLQGGSTSLGELLKRAREHRGLTLETVANETKIPQRHLEALEHDNLSAIPAGFYQRAEIRTYAQAVGLDQSIALARLEATLGPVDSWESSRQTERTPEPARPRAYTLILLGLVAAAAAVVGLAISERASTPQPDSGIRTSEPVVPSAPSATTSAPSNENETAGAGVVQNAGTPRQAAETLAPAHSVTELVVTTEPAGARVTVNGIGWGLTPVTIRYLPPGDKTIRVSKEGYSTSERVLRLTGGQQLAIDVQLEEAP
jgi:cytoskeletal protein RodZ